MTAWLALAVASIAGLGIIVLLGLPIALAVRVRGFAIAVVAVPAAFAAIGISSVVAAMAGLGWSLLAPLAVTLALTLVLVLFRRWIPGSRLPRSPRTNGGARGTTSLRDLALGVGAAAVGGGVIAVTVASAIGSGDAISQTFDAGFHLNAVRYILDTGSASPLGMDMAAPGSSAFYPTLWHAAVALIVQLTSATIPVATNALLFISAAVIWPIGAVALGRAIAGPSVHVTVIAGALAAAFPNFPLYLTGYGILYPNLLALALLPFLLVAGMLILASARSRTAFPLPPLARWLLLIGTLGAAVLAHPNVLYAAVIWGVFPVLAAAVRALRGQPIPSSSGGTTPSSAPRWLRSCGALIGVAVFMVGALALWRVGQTFDNSWQGSYGPRSAVLEILGGTPNLKGHAWGVAAITLIGVGIALRNRRLRWLVGSAAGLAFFYWAADGFTGGEWRSLLISPWYNDPRRLASLVPFGALPLAVLGAAAVWSLVRPGLYRFSRQVGASPSRRMRVLGAFGVILLLAIGQAGAKPAIDKVQEYYDLESARVVSEDELALIERIPSEVPDDETIVNNPLNGSALGYALGDRDVLFPHPNGSYEPERYELIRSIVDAPERACELADELHAHFVIDFGTDYIFKDDVNREKKFAGLEHVEDSPILTQIDRVGDVALYRISGCDALPAE